MSTAQSKKAKGRNLQKLVAKKILDTFPELLNEDDVRSCPMGSQGEDIMLSRAAREVLHCSFECKNQERFKALNDAFTQCEYNAKGFPVLVLKTNRADPFAVVSLDFLLDVLHLLYYTNKDWNLLLDPTRN